MKCFLIRYEGKNYNTQAEDISSALIKLSNYLKHLNTTVNDSDKVASEIKDIINFIRSIPNNVSGKSEKSYRSNIDQRIENAKKVLESEFSKISSHSDKISMQGSIRQMSGYFGNLIDMLKHKSHEVSDLTFSQYLYQEAISLNSWKHDKFRVR